jgi:O-antigen/teichoic acid export membrane protein
MLLLAIVWLAIPAQRSPAGATLCYASSWIIGLIVVIVLVRRTTPRLVSEAAPSYDARTWFRSALPFLYFALLITVLTKVGVIVLRLVAPDDAEVAIYAVAAETGMFILIVAKSTDKLFLPALSVLLERREFAAMRSARRRRAVSMTAICALFLIVIIVFGRPMLSMFGDEFEEGHLAVCIIAASTSVWTLFSLAPPFLKYVGRYSFVIAATVIAVAANVTLCAMLGSRFGATGAAVAYAVPVTLLFLTLAFTASRSLARYEREIAGAGDSEG